MKITAAELWKEKNGPEPIDPGRRTRSDLLAQENQIWRFRLLSCGLAGGANFSSNSLSVYSTKCEFDLVSHSTCIVLCRKHILLVWNKLANEWTPFTEHIFYQFMNVRVPLMNCPGY